MTRDTNKIYLKGNFNNISQLIDVGFFVENWLHRRAIHEIDKYISIVHYNGGCEGGSVSPSTLLRVLRVTQLFLF